MEWPINRSDSRISGHVGSEVINWGKDVGITAEDKIKVAEGGGHLSGCTVANQSSAGANERCILPVKNFDT
jgi:hypothetical protein